MSARLSLEVIAFAPCHRATLRGFVSVVIEEWRLRINDLTIHEQSRSRWVGMPARPLLDANGIVIRNERGKVSYFPVLAFTDAEARNGFGRRIIEELLIFAAAAFEREDA